MTLIELRNELKELCKKEGGALPWAKKHRIAHTYVSSVIRGSAKPGPKILKAIGRDKDVKVRVDFKFEDYAN